MPQNSWPEETRRIESPCTRTNRIKSVVLIRHLKDINWQLDFNQKFRVEVCTKSLILRITIEVA